jgi:hypothetical protein
MGAPTIHQLVSRSEFVSGMTTSWQSHLGSANVDVRLTSDPKLIDSTFGYWTAQANLSVRSASGSFGFSIILEYVDHQWLVLSVAPPES